MTEHEKLKEIIDLIGYDNKKYEIILDWLDQMIVRKNWGILTEWSRDVREIIFTTEFMDKYDYYRYNNDIYPIEANEILDHLEDPVSYLYNTLWLWTKK